MSYAVELIDISKRYGTVQALDSVSLKVKQGSIHAVVGENGAGKTTLMKALYGAMQPDSGSIDLFGKRLSFAGSAQAIEAGVGMVSQHYGIIGELSCLENLIVGSEGSGVLQLKAAEERANELAKKMGFEFDWKAEASTLSPAGAQKLEILKLLWRNSQIMILDEPTAMLSPADSDALFESLSNLAKEGATILVVTHRLPEVFGYCDEVTVLRGGKWIAAMPVSETDPESLAKAIVGGELVQRPPLSTATGSPTLLTVNDLSVKGPKGNLQLKNCSFQVRKGELVGIAGVDGSGQRELFQALMGTTKPVAGAIRFVEGSNEQDWTNLPTRERLKQGLRIIPEDRLAEAVIEEWSLIENATLGLQRIPPFDKLSGNAVEPEALKIADLFNTKRGSLNDSMAGLSGGNQQRFVAARALLYNPALVLAFQPARGLDLNSTARVYSKIRELCDSGTSALVVSFDLDELLEYCDRIVVLCSGEFAEPKPEEGRDRDAIGRLMVGAK